MTDLKKNPKPFSGETYGKEHVYRHVFNLDIWIRISGKNYWQTEYFSYNNKVSGWVDKRKNFLDVNMNGK